MMDEQGITLGTVLQHMQGMERRLSNDIKKVRTDLTARIDRMDQRLHRVESKVDLTSVQIQNMDERLDVLDIANLPKRVTDLENIAMR